MKMLVAFCTNASVFQENQILNPDIARLYPGALWIVFFASVAKKHGIEVVTGDVAIARLKKGACESSKVLVIQDDDCPLGLELIQLGARAFVLTCFESPLYAYNFYNNLVQVSNVFEHRILFRGSHSNTSILGLNHDLHFPCFSFESQMNCLPWERRRFLVMIAANKYWKPQRSKMRHIIASVRDVILGRPLYKSGDAQEKQLHDKRLEVIEYFGSKSKSMDLFGYGWDNISTLPRAWQSKLENIIANLSPSVCDDKQQIMSNYKFAICFENMSYPGYITEKIIDCFHAGVIPIYLGAPDIGDFIPKVAFIDMRAYENLNVLHEHLMHIDRIDAMNMVDAGQAFLSSSDGVEYSYEGFAKNVFSLIEEV